MKYISLFIFILSITSSSAGIKIGVMDIRGVPKDNIEILDLAELVQTEIIFEAKKVKWFEIIQETEFKKVKIDVLLVCKYNIKQKNFHFKIVKRNFEIPFSQHFSLTNKKNVKNFVIDLIENLKLLFPLEGEIITVTDNSVIINLGKNYDVKSGDAFIVKDANIAIALLRTIKIYNNTSEALIVRNNKPIKEGFKVLYKTPELLKEFNNPYVQLTPKSIDDIKIKNKEIIPGISGENILLLWSYDGMKLAIADDFGLFWFNIKQRQLFKVADYNFSQIKLLKWSSDSNLFAFTTSDNNFFLFDTNNEELKQLYFDNTKSIFFLDRATFKLLNHSVCGFAFQIKSNNIWILMDGLFLSDGNYFKKVEFENLNLQGLKITGADILPLYNDNFLILRIRPAGKNFFVDTSLKILKDEFSFSTAQELTSMPDENYISYFTDDKKFKIYSPDSSREILNNIEAMSYRWSDSGKYCGFLSEHQLKILEVDKQLSSDFFQGTILQNFEWVPNTDFLAISGRFEDNNSDRKIDWQDFNNIRLFDFKKNISKNFIIDIDKFWGISSTGQYLAYQKNNKIYLLLLKL